MNKKLHFETNHKPRASINPVLFTGLNCQATTVSFKPKTLPRFSKTHEKSNKPPKTQEKKSNSNSSLSPKKASTNSLDLKRSPQSLISLLSPNSQKFRFSLLATSTEKIWISAKTTPPSNNLAMQGLKISPKKKLVSSKSIKFEASSKEITKNNQITKDDDESSYSSSELENGVSDVNTINANLKHLQSMNSITKRKFELPLLMKQPSSRRTSVGSLMSEFSMRNFPSIKNTLRREATIEDILNEMSTTTSVALFNDLKFKFITKDKLLEGNNGNMLKWKVVEVIGMGSFGQVIKVINIETGKIFAVKRLFYNTNCNEQKVFIDSLITEVTTLKSLSHNHIVKYLGSETIEDNYCLYMEYLSGGSISKLIYNIGPLAEVTVRAYTRQILKGLMYLHENGIIHRDLKSDNLLMNSNGKIKVCDFGCSKRYESDLNESGIVNSVKGSLPWMAPEVMKQGGYGRKADIWSLGCVVIEMLTGKPPWGDVDNQMTLMMKVIVYNELPKIPNNITDVCKDFLLLCLDRDPNKRKSAKELFVHPFVLKIK